jgi:hypothetical protein
MPTMVSIPNQININYEPDARDESICLAAELAEFEHDIKGAHVPWTAEMSLGQLCQADQVGQVDQVPDKQLHTCDFCHRVFHWPAALKDHMISSRVCREWSQQYHELSKLTCVSQQELQSQRRKLQSKVDGNPRAGYLIGQHRLRQRFEVCQNLYLIDKELEPSLEDIDCVVNLSPSTPNTHAHIEYHRVPDSTKTSSNSVAELQGYKEAYTFVSERLALGLRVAVHCNTGFQRSIPFLTYCIMHDPKRLEYYLQQPTVRQALSCLSSFLPDLDIFKDALFDETCTRLERLFTEADVLDSRDT